MPKKVKPAPVLTTVTEYNKAIYFDPGERYTGVAIFERDQIDNTWDCVDAFTWDIEATDDDYDILKLETWLWNSLSRGEYDIVGYEVFRLYEDKAQEQKGREFLTCQLIGVIKFAARRLANQNRWPRQDLELVRFLPDFKKPTAGWMKKNGITSEARRRKTKGDHAWDAELQGYYDIVKNRGWKTSRKAPTS